MYPQCWMQLLQAGFVQSGWANISVKAVPVLNHTSGNEFSLSSNRIYFAATRDSFLSVLYLLCSFSSGRKIAMRFPSATINLLLPISTDPVPLSYSHPLHAWALWQPYWRDTSLSLGALGSLKLGLLFHHHCLETLLPRSVLPTRTTMAFSFDLLPLGCSGWTANPSAGFYSLKIWMVLVNCFHVSQFFILLKCLWREALLSTIPIVPSKLV